MAPQKERFPAFQGAGHKKRTRSKEHLSLWGQWGKMDFFSPSAQRVRPLFHALLHRTAVSIISRRTKTFGARLSPLEVDEGVSVFPGGGEKASELD